MDSIAAGLTSFWLGTRELNLAELERYYYGAQTTADNGMLTRVQADGRDIARFFKPINYVAAIVDEPVGYLAHGQVTVNAANNERLEAWAANYYTRRIAPRLDDAVRWQALYGEAYLYLWTDRDGASQGLKVDVLPPIEGGSPRVEADYGGQDSEELTAAVLYKRIPTRAGFDEYRITVTRERILVEKRHLETGQAGGASYTTRWEPVSDDTNPAGVLPVVPVFNPTPSDVLNMLPIQDDLDKLHLDMRMAREYGGFPMLTSDAPTLPDDLEIGPGRILFGGSYQQITPAPLDSFLQEREALLESAAKITKSLTLLTEAGTTQSGVALKFRQQAFLERLNGKARRLASAVEHALLVAARILAVDAELYKLETRRMDPSLTPSQAELAAGEFDVTLEPALPADELAQAQIAEILDRIGASRETVFAKAGIENPAEEVERAEEEAAALVERARRAEMMPAGENPEPVN